MTCMPHYIIHNEWIKISLKCKKQKATNTLSCYTVTSYKGYFCLFLLTFKDIYCPFIMCRACHIKVRSTIAQSSLRPVWFHQKHHIIIKLESWDTWLNKNYWDTKIAKIKKFRHQKYNYPFLIWVWIRWPFMSP